MGTSWTSAGWARMTRRAPWSPVMGARTERSPSGRSCFGRPRRDELPAARMTPTIGPVSGVLPSVTRDLDGLLERFQRLLGVIRRHARDGWDKHAVVAGCDDLGHDRE